MSDPGDEPFRDEEAPLASPISRFFKLGGLAARVGVSASVERALGILLSPVERERRNAELWARNGARIAQALGQLKGGPMKLGQMLSLQDDLLPAELAPFLRLLQQDAPPVPFEPLRRTLRHDFRPYREIFAEIDERPLASASIGQVHRGRLVDGREVAIKIQYPGIKKMIRADLRNLRLLVFAVGETFWKGDLEPFWDELEARLLEELDYRRELRTQAQFVARYEDVPGVTVPRPVPEASSARVLTSELVRGMSLDEALSERVDSPERDQWGRRLFDLFAEQLFSHGIIHADPNAANFAFLPEGGVVIYDFGSVKAVPDAIRRGYASIVRAVIERRVDELPRRLEQIGIHRINGARISQALVDAHVNAIEPLFVGEACLGGADSVVTRLMKLALEFPRESRDITIPPDALFVHRAMAGVMGNVARLGARARWIERLARFVADAERSETEGEL